MGAKDTGHVVSGGIFLQLAERWIAAVAPTDGPKLRQLVQLVGTRMEFTMVEALAVAFPEFQADSVKGRARFRAFRGRVNSIADEAGLGFRLMAGAGKGDSAPVRVWFTGPDLADAGARALGDASTLDVKGKPFTPPRGYPTEDGRRVVTYFLCYVRAEQALTTDLITRFEKCDGGTRFKLKRWDDKQIDPGAKWHVQIQEAIRSCDLALVMLSPALLKNGYVGTHEIPNFALDAENPGAKPVMPVGLAHIDLDLCIIPWVKDHQFFRIEDKKGQSVFYSELTTERRKNEFARLLYRRLHEKLERMFAESPQDPSPKPVMSVVEAQKAGTMELLRGLPDGMSEQDKVKCLIPPRGVAFRSLADTQSLDPAALPAASGEDALSYLHAWAVDPLGQPYLAILGVYGIGKTTTLKHFTRELLKKGPPAPLPIYIDLRLPKWKPDELPESLEELLAEAIRCNWRLDGPPTVTPGDLLRLVREQGALLIIDGLDEKIVHLHPRDAQAFIRLLWQALPPAAYAPRPIEPVATRPGRLIISCRSQYFRDLTSQNALLTGEDREGIARGGTPAFCLLPFNEDQIRAYLLGIHDGDAARAAAAGELIDSIHNLRELAARPYLLSVITERLAELEALRARGETVNSARLYQLFTERWLARDNGKHTLEPAHKRVIMEHLALAFWREGAREWDVDRLEEWFEAFLLAHPAMGAAYAGKERSILKEDLRTATFVLRPDAEEKHFRFAHTSLLEFFVAARLWRALTDGTAAETWALPEPSAETFVFLGELLALERRPEAALRTLETLLGVGALPAGRHALRLWLLANQRGWPQPAPERVVLAGADLEGWRIAGRSAAEPLRLGGADLRGAQMGYAKLENVYLADADLSDAACAVSEWVGVDLSRATLDRADFAGAILRECRAEGLRGTGARWHEVEWSRCDLRGAELGAEFDRAGAWAECAGAASVVPADLPPALEALIRGAHGVGVTSCVWSPDGRRLASGSYDLMVRVWDAESGKCLRSLVGHENGVTSCAWSPDGRRLASGSEDKTVRVWDAENGKCLRGLVGHEYGVNSCAWSADSRRLASGSSDKTVRVWDAESGKCLGILVGHENRVTSCGWSADGRRLASGSLDETVRLWDVESGECLRSLVGHEHRVNSCTWSPDGRRLASGSEDHTVRVWDAESGKCLRTLIGHENPVTSCAWSPDGRRLVSGSYGAVMVWEAESGKCLRTLIGHEFEVNSCAWSPDGRRLVSGSGDNTVRVWDAESGKCLWTLRNHQNQVTSCAWSPDGRRLVSGSNDYTVRVWDAESGKCLRTLMGHESWVFSCAWSADGWRLASGSEDTMVRVWDAESGKCLRTLMGHEFGVGSCAWSPDGRRLASGSNDHTIRVWDAESGKCLRSLAGHEKWVTSCAWSPDGRRLASGSGDNTVRVWDAESGKCLCSLAGHEDWVYSCEWSPDGRRLASGSKDKTLRLWDAERGKCLHSLRGHHNKVSSCAWSPDGRRLASASWDKTVKVWDTESGKCLRTLMGHESWVTSCAWSSDGRRLASAGDDRTARVWDAESGAELIALAHLPDGEAAAVDVPGNRFLWASPGAWRHLAWRVYDPLSQRTRILPAEFCGPLPGAE